MRHPFRRVNLYTLLTITISFTLFYLFRNRLTGAFVGVFVQDLHLLPADWVYSELVVGLFGLEACFNGWVFSKVHGWRHKAKPDQALIELGPKLDTLSGNMKSLNENVWKLFKYFNPVLERNGLRFELDEVGKITLRDAAAQVQRKHELLKKNEQERKDLQDIPVVT